MKRTRALSSKHSSLMLAAGLGFGGYLLYSLFKNTAQAHTPAPGNAPARPGGFLSPVSYTPAALDVAVPGVSFAPSTLQPGILTSILTAVPAVTGAQVSAANSFWATLQPVAAIDTGYITFPSGSQVAASLMSAGNTALDANGNYYVLWAGQVYQLGTQTSDGNWPAIPVTGN